MQVRVTDSQVWSRLERIRFALGLSESEFAQILKLTDEDYRELRKSRKAPSIASILPLLSESNLSIEKFMIGDIDIQAVEAHYRKDLDFIPETYRRGAFSRRRSPLHLLDFLEKRYGWEMRASVLSHFQITETAIARTDEMISLRFLTDVADYLRRWGHDEELFYEAGLHSAVVNWNSSFAASLRSQPDLKAVYEKGIAELMNFIERNHHYQLTRLSDTRAALVSRPREEVLSEWGANTIGNAWLCRMRAGVGAAFVRYLGLPEAHAIEVKCIHRGDPYCQFEFDFEKARSLVRQIRPMERPQALQ